MSDIKKFYMVMGLGQGAPTVKHPNREKAFSEAQRLARNHPGVEFYVLETVARAVTNAVQFEVFPDPSQICMAAAGDWWRNQR